MKSRAKLDQFDNDNEAGDYDSLRDISKELSQTIGEFLIVFSGLEHIINLNVSGMISDRSHEIGYRVLKTLSMKNKIDFLHSALLRFISEGNQNTGEELIKLKARLENINSFRNKVVHANWGTLKRNGEVRTKITTDSSDGSVEFENFTITRTILNEAISETDSLIEEIDEFYMETVNTALTEKRG